MREWNAEFKRAKGLLKEISDLSERIVRGYVAGRRRQVGGSGAEETARA